MINVVCVWWGTKFPFAYVQNLKSMITFAKILLYGVLATVSANIGISIFYVIFPPEDFNSINNFHAICAAIVGVICASIFLVPMVRSVSSGKKK